MRTDLVYTKRKQAKIARNKKRRDAKRLKKRKALDMRAWMLSPKRHK